MSRAKLIARTSSPLVHSHQHSRSWRQRCWLPGWHLVLLLHLLALQTVFVTPTHGETAPLSSLSADEKAWLKRHPVIRIGVDAEYAPYSFKSNDGSYQGVAPDFIDRISKDLGVRFEIIPNLSWSQILKDTEDRQLDMIATVVKTPEREKYLNFSQIYIPTPLVIMTRKDDYRIGNNRELAGKRIAMVKGYYSSDRVVREHPSIQHYWVNTSVDGLRAVATGKADAYIGVLGVSTFTASKYGIFNLKVAAPYDKGLIGQRFGVRQDWPELISILNKSLNAIPESEKIAILKKWVPINVDTAKHPTLELTSEEKRWLAQHRQIRLAVDPDFAPVEFVDEKGSYSGISAEYIKRINRMLNINMTVVPGINWSDALALAKKGEIDVFAAITPSDERNIFLNFTRSYIKYPVAIYTRETTSFIPGLSGLVGKKVAVVKDYYMHEVLRRLHPQLNLAPAPSTHDALSNLATGGADAFVGDIATTTYAIRKYNFTNLKIAAPAEINSPGLSIGVRKDWPELIEILNKALDSIPPEERLDISRKWIEINVDQYPRYWTWIAIGALAFMVLFIAASSILRVQVRRRTAELEQENNDRKRAEKALIDSEQRLTQFFNATFEMVFFHDGGRILDVNPATMRVTGYTPEEIIGRNLLDFVADDSKQHVIENMRESTLEAYEANIISKRGQSIPVEIHAKNIETNGRMERVVNLRDITERKRNELALQHAHDQLEIKVAERTAELSKANAKLKELDKLKSMFIASVSHELRTPLNSIIGFSGMMVRGAFGELSKKYLDYATRINQSGQHLLSLITDIIDISKIESGRIDIEPSEVSLHDLVADALVTIREQAEKKGLSITMDVPAALTAVTDKRRLLQCLLNFLSNAVKYSEHGQISVTAQEGEHDIIIFVRDTGIGIAQADMPKLYEAFERIDSHLRVKAGGTGLGLYLTKKIVTELLQGNVGAESTPGKGSTFWMRFSKTAGHR